MYCPVKVKWGKENFDGIDLNSDDEPVVFKAQLFALTGVQVDRQKLMFKGKVIGNSWDTVPLKEVSVKRIMHESLPSWC